MENYGVKPGNRVLIRSGNNPALVAAWLAATKAGAVVVNTMPLLRAGELSKIVDKAEIALALTDSRIADELVACAKTSRFLKQVVNFDGTSNHDAELDRVALSKPVRFEAVKTGRDDVALARIHLGHHGRAEGDDAFPSRSPDRRRWLCEGSAQGDAGRCVRRLAAAGFHLRARGPCDVSAAVRRHRDAAGKRRAGRDGQDHRDLQGHDLLHLADRLSRDDGAMDKGADLSSLRLAVSAGETLPAPVFEAWTRKTGKTMLDGIGSTEMLHIFISNRDRRCRRRHDRHAGYRL